jgi:hypothetical protein
MFLIPYVSLVSCGVLGPNWLAIDNILMCNGRKLSFTGRIPPPVEWDQYLMELLGQSRRDELFTS